MKNLEKCSSKVGSDPAGYQVEVLKMVHRRATIKGLNVAPRKSEEVRVCMGIVCVPSPSMVPIPNGPLQKCLQRIANPQWKFDWFFCFNYINLLEKYQFINWYTC